MQHDLMEWEINSMVFLRQFAAFCMSFSTFSLTHALPAVGVWLGIQASQLGLGGKALWFELRLHKSNIGLFELHHLKLTIVFTLQNY